MFSTFSTFDRNGNLNDGIGNNFIAKESMKRRRDDEFDPDESFVGTKRMKTSEPEENMTLRIETIPVHSVANSNVVVIKSPSGRSGCGYVAGVGRMGCAK